MYKDAINKILKQVFNSKMFLLLMFYLIIGAIFTSFQYIDSDYLYIFTQVLTNKIYITMFVFPVLIIMYLYLYKIINNNYFFLIRVGNKKQLIKILLELGFKFITYYMLVLILIIGISTNITAHKNNLNTHSLEYKNSDIFVLLTSIIKIYAFMFIYYLATLIISTKTKKPQITLIILMIILMIIFLNSKFSLSGNLLILNIDIHFYNIRVFNNIFTSLLYTFIYDFFIVTILLKVLKRTILERF